MTDEVEEEISQSGRSGNPESGPESPPANKGLTEEQSGADRAGSEDPGPTTEDQASKGVDKPAPGSPGSGTDSGEEPQNKQPRRRPHPATGVFE